MFIRMGTVPLAAAVVAAIIATSGCSAGGYNVSPSGSQPSLSMGQSGGHDLSPDASVLKQLTKQVVIGSAVDPTNGAQNPYGLTVAPITSGTFTKGDLVVCNFNAKSNVQGTGKSIVALHPIPKSKPLHISSDKTLLGCDALALDDGDTIWAAAMVANDNPVLDPTGKLITNISGKPFDQPWGQIYAETKTGSPAFYATNAGTGTVVRINLGSKFTYDVIGKGFPVNHGKPGTALAPSGLAYDANVDTLYFVDGQNNTIVAFKDVTDIPKGGIKATDNGMKFTGPSAGDARIVFAGAPLNGPISTALLPNGNLVVGNTLDPNGKNLMIEVSSAGKLLDVRNVDKGASGTLFGMVATGTKNSDTKIYFNDDNDNNVQVLEH
jgi:sugar lactone lactonase YvrE